MPGPIVEADSKPGGTSGKTHVSSVTPRLRCDLEALHVGEPGIGRTLGGVVDETPQAEHAVGKLRAEFLASQLQEGDVVLLCEAAAASVAITAPLSQWTMQCG